MSCATLKQLAVRAPVQTVGAVIHHAMMRFLLIGCRGGFASVSKAGIRGTLALRKRALLWPGGVRESLLAAAADPVSTSHQGFLRLAVAEDAACVPVFVDGETSCVGNAAPALTRACYRYFGLPLSWTYLKSRPHLVVRYGRPVYPVRGEGDVIEATARAFWNELAELRAKAEAEAALGAARAEAAVERAAAEAAAAEATDAAARAETAAARSSSAASAAAAAAAAFAGTAVEERAAAVATAVAARKTRGAPSSAPPCGAS